MADESTNALLRALPKIDEVLQRVQLPEAVESTLPPDVVTRAARVEVDALRTRILGGEAVSAPELDPARVAQGVLLRVLSFARTGPAYPVAAKLIKRYLGHRRTFL